MYRVLDTVKTGTTYFAFMGMYGNDVERNRR